MTSGKTIALTRWNSVSKVMSLLFNIREMQIKTTVKCTRIAVIKKIITSVGKNVITLENNLSLTEKVKERAFLK